MGNKWTKTFELSGKERKEALEKCCAVLRKWQIKMPKVKPLVLNFGLGDFYKNGLIEFWIANEKKEGYCGKFLFVFNHQTCPFHHHNFKHETFFVLKGKVEMNIDGKKSMMNAGDIKVMPQGNKHSFTGKGSTLLLEVSKPCISGDSIFRNKKIGSI